MTLSRTSQALLLALTLSATACAEPAAPNLLENAGFEEGREPWTRMGGSVWGAFEIVEDQAHSGESSAYLPVVWESGKPGQKVKVFGVVQEPSPEVFPETLSGWYRVGDWWSESPATQLYVQVVVIVWDDPKTAELVGVRSGSPIKNYQLRYYLAGVDEPPFLLANAKVKFAGKGPPKRDQWLRFELPIRQDFQELWGHVPSDFSSLRVLFEARWDDKPEGAGVRAEVWYDDLVLEAGPGADSVR
jgi:hypothetical protein